MINFVHLLISKWEVHIQREHSSGLSMDFGIRHAWMNERLTLTLAGGALDKLLNPFKLIHLSQKCG